MLANGVMERAGAPGDAVACALAGAAPGATAWATFFADGAPVFYAITDGIQLEEGIGTYSANPPTINRNTVLSTSAAGRNGPTRLAFATQVLVYSTLPAEQAVWRKALPWDLVETRAIAAGTALAQFAVPSDATCCQMQLRGLNPSDNLGSAILRVSADGAADVAAGYAQSGQDIDRLAAGPYSSTGNTGIALSGLGTMNLCGDLALSVAAGAVFVRLDTVGVLPGGGATRRVASGYVAGTAALRRVSLTVEGGSANTFGGGIVRVLAGYS